MATSEQQAERAEDAFDEDVAAAFIVAVQGGARRPVLIGGLAGTVTALMQRELDAETRTELIEAMCNAFNLKVAL